MPRIAAATVATPGYLARACALARSLERHAPGLELFGLLAARRERFPAPGDLPFTPLFVEELEQPPTPAARFRCGGDLAFALKPALVETLGARGVERILYLDADTQALAPLDPLLARLELHPLVVFPVIAAPPRTPVVAPEGLLRRTGLLSAGCFAARRERQIIEFLEFWRRQLERSAAADPWLGLLNDQSWFDFAAVFVDGVEVVRERAEHLGYWNLDGDRLERRGGAWTLAGRPVRILHASGFDPDRPDRLSRHLPAEQAAAARALAPLLADYAREVADCAARWPLPAGFDEPERFTGTDLEIPLAARALVAAVDPLGVRWPDPSDPRGPESFLSWLTAPVISEAGAMPRAALALWELRTDLVDAFPDPCGASLARFARWLIEDGGARTAGIDLRLLEALRVESEGGGASGERRGGGAPGAPRRPELRDPRGAALARRIADPGSPTAAWLDESVAGDPPLPRTALLYHRRRPDLQRRFRDPAGADREAFARWFAEEGIRELEREPR
jgi:hypothetical protein